jgi:hypothetical protein
MNGKVMVSSWPGEGEGQSSVPARAVKVEGMFASCQGHSEKHTSFLPSQSCLGRAEDLVTGDLEVIFL